MNVGADHTFPAEPWGSKLRSILTGVCGPTHFLQWDDVTICSGEILELSETEMKLGLFPFEPHRGFNDEAETKVFDIHISNFSRRSIKLAPNCWVVCAGKADFVLNQDRVCFSDQTVLQHRPELSHHMAWDVCHLFCGAFEGWSRALAWLSGKGLNLSVRREIHIDHCPRVMQTWSHNHGTEAYRAPLDATMPWDPTKQIGILADVSDLSCFHMVETQMNSLLTCSPPCVSWSAGGKGLGLASCEGWSMVNCVRAAVVTQPHIVTMECADKIESHPHLIHVEKLMNLVGFVLIWKQVVPLHALTHNNRTRWLAVWVRAGEKPRALDCHVHLAASPRAPWSDACYSFSLPTKIRDQLFLNAEEQEIYGDWTLLPPAKRARYQDTEPSVVLRARVASTSDSLPTLCANYTVQHCLSSSHLQHRGLFASLQLLDKSFAFLDPVRFACLLGPTTAIAMPLTQADAYHHLGNAIAVPHALLALTVGLVAVTPIDVNIPSLVQTCWNERLTSHNALLVCEDTMWTLVPLDQSLEQCHLQSQTHQIDGELQPFRVHCRKQIETYYIPFEWTQAQFLRHIFVAPESFVQHLRIVSEPPVCYQHDIGFIVQHHQHFQIMLGGHCLAQCEALDSPPGVPATLPYPIDGLTCSPHESVLHLDEPSAEDFFDSPLGLGIIRYIEKCKTPFDYRHRKHEVLIALPVYPIVMRIAVEPLEIPAQIRELAVEIGCSQVSRPVSTLHPPRDVFVLHDHRVARKAVLFDVQGLPDAIYAQYFPETFDSSRVLGIGRQEYHIKYVNNASPASTMLTFRDADVLTLTQCIHAGGHHSTQAPPALPQGSDFEMRCKFSNETHGWLASDELHFAVVHLAWARPGFGHFTGPVVWDTAINVWHPMHQGLTFPQSTKCILPVLVDNHWTALEIHQTPHLTTVACVGLSPHLAPRVPQILAPWLSVRPGLIRVYCRAMPEHPHMCGWHLLYKWFTEAGLLDGVPDLANELPLLPRHLANMIDDALANTASFWQQTQASGPVKQLAYRIRQNHLISLAQASLRHLEVTDHRLLTEASQFEKPVPPQKPLDFDDSIQTRLAHFQNHPGWLASDELDFLLDHVRCQTSHTLFLPPAKWTSRNTLSFFGGLHVDVRPVSQFVCFVLIEQHWIMLGVQQNAQGVVVTFAAPPQFRTLIFPLRLLIATLLGTHVENIRTVHVFVQTPQGLCGWTLLRDLFQHCQVSLQPLRRTHLDLLNNANAANSFVQVRQAASAAWHAATNDTQLQAFAHNGRGLFLMRILEGRFSAGYEAGGAAPDASAPAGTPAQASTDSAVLSSPVDPLWLKDPWARPQKKGYTKWEDLSLPTDHPFMHNGLQLVQTHRAEAANKREGIVMTTKGYITELLKIPTTKPLALLLPPLDLTSLGSLAGKVQGPYEIIVNDASQQTSYKRLAVVLPVYGSIVYQLPQPTCKFTAKACAELVLELDSRLLAPLDFQQATESPIQTFRKLILSIHTALPEAIVLYGLKKGKHPTAGKDDVQLQCMTRVPSDTRKSILEQSGAHGLLIRDFLERGKNAEDATILPKFWDPTLKELHDIQIRVKHIEGQAGIVLTKRGLALRVWTTKIAEARKALLPGDPRLTSENLHVVPRIMLESSGWPPATEAVDVIKTVTKATGKPPVPTKAFRAAGVFGWSLAFEERPTITKFSVDINGSTYEVLLTEPQMPSYKNGGRNQPQKAPKPSTKTPPTRPEEPTPVFPAAVVKHPESERIDRLEARMNQLDTRQSRLETQLNTRFDEVGAQLQKILSNTMPSRPREPSGDTPPPKIPRNQQ